MNAWRDKGERTEICHKVAWPNRRLANRELNRMRQAALGHEVDFYDEGLRLGIYRCDLCGGWHTGNTRMVAAIQEAGARLAERKRRRKRYYRELLAARAAEQEAIA